MNKLLLILFIFLSGSAYAADQYKLNPYTGKFDNAGPIGLSGLNGNIGINSASPGQTLDVQGTVRAISFIGDGSLLTGISSSNYWLNNTGNVGINTTYNVGIGTQSVTNTLNIKGNIGIGTVAGDAYLTTAAPLGGMIVQGNVGIGTRFPSTLFEVGAQRFNVLTGGNVGVANNNPQFKLSVAGTGYFSGALTLGSSIDLIINGQTWSGASNPSTPPTGWSIVFFGTGSITNNNPLLLFSIGTNDIYIYQAVPTVIGTSYTVKSTWSGVGGSFNGILRAGTSANDNSLGQSALGNGVNGTNSISFTASGTTTYITCYAGNVGNGSLSNVNMFASSVNGSVLQAYGGVSIGTSFASISPPMSGVIIQGNVGINTTNPGQPLEVSGNIRSTGTNTHIFGSDNTAWIGSSAASSGALTFNTASAEKVRISNTGNVGIASTNPGSLLDIAGGRMRTVGIGTTVPQAACIKSDGTFGYYQTTTFSGTCL